MSRQSFFNRRVRTAAGAIALTFGLAVAAYPQTQAGDAAPLASQTAADAVPPAPVQTSALPARLSDVEGAVQVTQLPAAPASTADHVPAPLTPDQVPPPPADAAGQQALTNMPVLAGMRVDTGADGRAELQFDDGSVVRLTPNSSVIIVDIESAGEQLRVLRGLSYYEVPQGGAGALVLEAGPDQIRVAQDSLLRADLDAAPFQIAVLRGAAHFNNKASDIGFEAITGETATLDPAAPTAYDVKQDLASNSWDSWNVDRDSTLAELAQNQTNARIGDGDASSQAWNDLDYYGTWYDVPGAGMAWAPDGVDASFDPYGAGAWGNYAGVGLTWVSSYPWGWLPYHCGGWGYFNSFGWLWQPGGGCGGFGGVGWYPYTGVHHPPHGYSLPIRPLDPRLHLRLGAGRPLPRSLPLAPVQRGAGFRFRAVGGTRPEPRAFPLPKQATADDSAPAYAATLPIMNGRPASQQYGQQYGQQFGQGGSGFTGAGNTGLPTHPGMRGNAIYGPPGVISSTPRVLSPPRSAIPPAPARLAPAPTPRYSAPAPAPHYAAPAPAAAAPHGR